MSNSLDYSAKLVNGSTFNKVVNKNGKAEYFLTNSKNERVSPTATKGAVAFKGFGYILGNTVTTIYGQTKKFGEKIIIQNRFDGLVTLEDPQGPYANTHAYMDVLGRVSKDPEQSGVDFLKFAKGEIKLEDLKTPYFADPVFRRGLIAELRRQAILEIDNANEEKLMQLKPKQYKDALNYINKQLKSVQKASSKQEDINLSPIDRIQKIFDNWQEFLQKLNNGDLKLED